MATTAPQRAHDTTSHRALQRDAQQLRANLLERSARLRSEQGDASQAGALREQLKHCGCAPVMLERP